MHHSRKAICDYDDDDLFLNEIHCPRAQNLPRACIVPPKNILVEVGNPDDPCTQNCPPQDCPPCGQSWGGQAWGSPKSIKFHTFEPTFRTDKFLHELTLQIVGKYKSWSGSVYKSFSFANLAVGLIYAIQTGIKTYVYQDIGFVKSFTQVFTRYDHTRMNTGSGVSCQDKRPLDRL